MKPLTVFEAEAEARWRWAASSHEAWLGIRAECASLSKLERNDSDRS